MNAKTIVNKLLEYGYDEPLWKKTLPTQKNFDPELLGNVIGGNLVEAIVELMESSVSNESTYALIHAALEPFRRALDQKKMPGPEYAAATLIAMRSQSGGAAFTE